MRIQDPNLWIDEYGNRHLPKDGNMEKSELARGGQGVVYRTQDEDLAVKVSLNEGNSESMGKLFQHIRTLPLPKGIQISLPLSILRGNSKPGYVMKLLNGMTAFSVFSLNGEQRSKIKDGDIPEWLSFVKDKGLAQDLTYYAETGSTRRRFYALYKCASILARLHNAGIVYGDVSANNVFIGEGIPCDCWLIDADNMRYEIPKGGGAVYTPRLGAPEIVQGKDGGRPRTDCWAFAVMAFQILSLIHPFIGKKVLEPEDDIGWDAEPSSDGVPSDLDEQAYAGFLPFIDDEDDDSNEYPGCLQRPLILTPQLRRLFQETFGAGRQHPHRRPGMSFWALELARAFDQSVVCPNCRMSSIFEPDSRICPYCRNPLPAFVTARTSRWRMNLMPPVSSFRHGISSGGDTAVPATDGESAKTNADTFETALPHRLFHPFSLESGDSAEYEAVIDIRNKTVVPVRGTKPFPQDLTFEFVTPGSSGKDGAK